MLLHSLIHWLVITVWVLIIIDSFNHINVSYEYVSGCVHVAGYVAVGLTHLHA